jgi:predicted XRE-type DNA-binding protein
LKGGEIMIYKIAVGEMEALETLGEMDSVNAFITSIKPSDIPLAAGVNVDELKAADNDPLEVVVEIPATKSKRGWNYTKESLKDIVDYTKANTLNGFLGHQKAEDVSTQFVPPVTHWIGAEMRGDKAYFRGLIDADATNLKRWVRTKRIQEVSIFGYPKLKKASSGEMDVVGYDPLSIDWTPLHRPGMPTSIIGMEMDDKNKGKEGGNNNMTFEELMSKLKELIKDGKASKESIAKSLGIKIEKEKDPEGGDNKQDKKDKTSGEMDEVIEKAIKMLEKQSKTEQVETIDNLIKKKVTGEMAQGLVKKMLNVPQEADKELISGEIDSILSDDLVKTLISNQHLDTGTGTGGAGNNTSSSLKVKKTRI